MLAFPPLDARALRLQFDRRAARFEQADFMLREVERRALERLDYIKLQPKDLLDVGCGLGAGAAALAARYPQAAVLAVDASPAMAARCAARISRRAGVVAQLARLLGAAARGGAARGGVRGAHAVVADGHALPFADAQFDLVWSNLALHWFVDPIAALTEWRRTLRPEGLLMFTAFGVDTLRELRAAGAQTMAFHDMHDFGDALVNAGFAEPVMDMEMLTLTYPTPEQLLADVRALGGNARADRRRGLAGRQFLTAVHRALDARRDAAHDGALVLSFEVIYGHAWVPKPSRLPPGYAPIGIVRKPPGEAS